MDIQPADVRAGVTSNPSSYTGAVRAGGDEANTAKTCTPAPWRAGGVEA